MSKELKEKKENELVKMLAEKREELRNFRFAIAGSKQKNVKQGKSSRKEIARILTEIKKRAA